MFGPTYGLSQDSGPSAHKWASPVTPHPSPRLLEVPECSMHAPLEIPAEGCQEVQNHEDHSGADVGSESGAGP